MGDYDPVRVVGCAAIVALSALLWLGILRLAGEVWHWWPT